MEVPLENTVAAFNAQKDFPARFRVTEGGPLDYSSRMLGPFRSEGQITRGQTREFAAPVIVGATDRTVFEVTYPRPDPVIRPPNYIGPDPDPEPPLKVSEEWMSERGTPPELVDGTEAGDE